MRAVEIWERVAPEQGNAIEAELLWSRYSPVPEQDLHSGVRETHSRSRFHYRCPAQQAAGG
jgi:hypothetical protein